MASIRSSPNNRGPTLLTIGIVAHTSRGADAKALAHQVGADFISIDNGVMGCDDNHDHVLHHLSALPSTWSVVLEDDAVPVAGFRDQLAAALPLCPAPIASLYLGRMRPPQHQADIAAAVEAAEIENADWIISSRLYHAVGYAIRTELLPSLLTHLSNWPVDQHISEWAQRYGYTVAHTWPSLVDHADGDTIVDHPDGQPRPPGRVAWKTGGHHTWTSRSVTLTPKGQP